VVWEGKGGSFLEHARREGRRRRRRGEGSLLSSCAQSTVDHHDRRSCSDCDNVTDDDKGSPFFSAEGHVSDAWMRRLPDRHSFLGYELVKL
jgi:hypothetical protein